MAAELTDEELATAIYALNCELFQRRANPQGVYTVKMQAAKKRLEAIQLERLELKARQRNETIDK